MILTNVFIDRATWHHSQGGPGSYLLTPEEKMCCLGFAAISFGASREIISGITSPTTLYDHIKEKTGFAPTGEFFDHLVEVRHSNDPDDGSLYTGAYGTKVCSQMMSENDEIPAYYIKDSYKKLLEYYTEKEYRLMDLAAEAGMNFVFHGEHPVEYK